MLRQDFAEQQIGVGHRQRAAFAVAGGAGIGAGTFGPGAQAGAIEGQNGAAAGRHGVDGEHRGAQPHPGDFGLKRALIGAVVERHIGAGAAHVEADNGVETGRGGGAHGADNAAGRAGEDRILAGRMHRPGPARHATA